MRILLYRGRGFWSALVRFFSRAKYAHVSIQFDGGEVYEAWPGVGVRRTTLKDTEDVTPYELQHELFFDEEATIRKFCDDVVHTNKGYDYLGVVGFVFGLKQRKTFARRWFCSEFVFAALQAGGVRLLERTEPWEVSPELIAKSPLIRP